MPSLAGLWTGALAGLYGSFEQFPEPPFKREPGEQGGPLDFLLGDPQGFRLRFATRREARNSAPLGAPAPDRPNAEAVRW